MLGHWSYLCFNRLKSFRKPTKFDCDRTVMTFGTRTLTYALDLSRQRFTCLSTIRKTNLTVGLLAEDSGQSIHAIVYHLARRYASLDPKRRAVQVMRALEMRKKTATNEFKEGKRKEHWRKEKKGETERMMGPLKSHLIRPFLTPPMRSFSSLKVPPMPPPTTMKTMVHFHSIMGKNS